MKQKRRAVFRKRIGKFEKKNRADFTGIEEGQKDIESMHEYYWENYAEMDQYEVIKDHEIISRYCYIGSMPIRKSWI